MPLAVRCNAFGPPESLTVEDLDPLPPGPDDVILRVLTAGEPEPHSHRTAAGSSAL